VPSTVGVSSSLGVGVLGLVRVEAPSSSQTVKSVYPVIAPSRKLSVRKLVPTAISPGSSNGTSREAT